MTSPPLDEAIQLLGTSRTFAGLTREDLTPFIQSAELREFQPGETVYRSQDRPAYGLILLSGCIEQTEQIVPGQAISRQTYATGSLFSEAGFVKAWQHQHDCVAIEATRALAIERSQFFHLLNSGNNVAFRILEALMNLYVRKVRDANRDLDQLYSQPESTLLLLRGLVNPGDSATASAKEEG